MAERIVATIHGYAVFVAEAGTELSAGKIFLPIWCWPSILAATGDRLDGHQNLQDQLFNKDIPDGVKSLKAPVRGGLVEGAGQPRLPHHLGPVPRRRPLPDPGGRCRSRPHRPFRQSHESGDKAECLRCSRIRRSGTPPPRPATTAWARTAPGLQGLLRHAGAARGDGGSDLVVVNHHLFFADVMLRDEGMAELLPACNTVILDEAHQLPRSGHACFRRHGVHGPGARSGPGRPRRGHGQCPRLP